LCEVADQWSYIELPGYTGASREKLIMAAAGAAPELVGGLRQPLRRFTAEFRRPLYVLDEVTVKTRAFAAGDRLAFIHRVIRTGHDDQECAIAVELF
jgi:hypothetical protein